jgi:hypothetical protein
LCFETRGPRQMCDRWGALSAPDRDHSDHGGTWPVCPPPSTAVPLLANRGQGSRANTRSWSRSPWPRPPGKAQLAQLPPGAQRPICRRLPSVGPAVAAGPWAGLVRLLPKGDRPSPPPSAASPPPAVAERRASAHSPWRVRRPSMLAHDAYIRGPCSSQRRPRSTLQSRPQCAAGKWPREANRAGPGSEGTHYNAARFAPPRGFPTVICEIGSRPPTDFLSI